MSGPKPDALPLGDALFIYFLFTFYFLLLSYISYSYTYILFLNQTFKLCSFFFKKKKNSALRAKHLHVPLLDPHVLCRSNTFTFTCPFLPQRGTAKYTCPTPSVKGQSTCDANLLCQSQIGTALVPHTFGEGAKYVCAPTCPYKARHSTSLQGTHSKARTAFNKLAKIKIVTNAKQKKIIVLFFKRFLLFCNKKNLSNGNTFLKPKC